MPDTVLTSLLLFAVGLVAGTLNVLAGGGSMIALPVMIFLGLPATVANGTNRVAILLQNVGAASSFHRRRLISPAWLRFGVPPAFVGAALGTWAAVVVGDVAFQKILAAVLVLATAWMLWHPVKAPTEGDTVPPTGRARWGFLALFFLVGVYGGFIQAGIGFVILAVTSAAGLDLVRGNALKVTLVLTFTPLALAIFAFSGKVDWAMGLALAAGNVLGAQVGVHLVVLKGHAWIRRVVTVTIVIFALKLFFTG
ncbi:MAG: sulfite exporter TauE/SafE family protein [Gemmatimonadota bacterium]|nr:sulfite exporter TauE/SafE family protein [Gemmatimonadota bacterium]MDH5761090.1 sulfite exporter TauE/SafE family protein [Gemmatimonadota bacterium]